MGATIRIRGKNKGVYVRLQHGSRRIESRVQGLNLVHFRWSQSKQKVLNKGKEATNLNNFFRKLIEGIENGVNNIGIEGQVLDVKWLQRRIDDIYHPIEEQSFEKVIQFTDRMLKDPEISKSRRKDFISWKNNFIRFQEELNRTLLFKELDAELMRTYRFWSQNEENAWSPSYIAKQVSTLKTICRKAREEGIAVNPFFDAVKTPTITTREENTVVLNWKELDKIEALENLPPYLERVRLWLYLGVCIGQRGNDLLNITKENIKVIDGRTFVVDVYQAKTEGLITAEVWYEKALETLERIGELTEDRKRISLQKFNDYLKVLCETAGIDDITKGYITENKRRVLKEVQKHKLCSSHMMRRTFSTLAFQGGVPPHIIMDITGHKDLTTFQKYIGVTESKIERAKAFGDAIRKVKQSITK